MFFSQNGKRFSNPERLLLPLGKQLLLGAAGGILGYLAYLTWRNQHPELSNVSIDPDDPRAFSIDKDLPLHYKRIKKLRAQWESEHAGHRSFFLSHLEKDTYHKKLFIRAHAIKEMYKDTHYVFIHAQSTKFTPFIYLMNLIIKRDQSVKTRFFNYIRKLQPLEQADLEVLLTSTKACGSDHEFTVREAIISADAYFKNKTYAESAWHFLMENRSIIMKCIEIQDLVPNLFGVESMADKRYKTALDAGAKIQALSQSLYKNAPCGNLWVFCIPKHLIEQDAQHGLIAYRSHPHGEKCSCHEGMEIKILQDLQNDKIDESSRCKRPYPTPQYRLVLQSLKPEDGVLCFFLTPFTKAQRQAIKAEVKDILTAYESEITTPSITLT